MNRTLASSLLLLAAAPTLAVAQSPCHAENDGPVFNDLVSMGGPMLLLAVRFDSSTTFDCTGIEVFTGEGTGTNSVAIWSHDAGANEPDTLLGVGFWSMDSTNSWQGAVLGSSVPLTAGQTYWMVWGPVNGSQASVDAPMGSPGQPYRGSFDGGANWNGPFQFNDRHWKFRLFGSCTAGSGICYGDGGGTACPCGNEDAGGGVGCSNSSGNGAGLTASGSTSLLAADLTLHATNAIPNQPGLFFQGNNAINGGNGIAFGDGLRCAGDDVVRLEVVNPDANGDASSGVDIGTMGGNSPGDQRTYQYWYRDPVGGPCGAGFNLTNAIQLTWGA